MQGCFCHWTWQVSDKTNEQKSDWENWFQSAFYQFLRQIELFDNFEFNIIRQIETDILLLPPSCHQNNSVEKYYKKRLRYLRQINVFTRGV